MKKVIISLCGIAVAELLEHTNTVDKPLHTRRFSTAKAVVVDTKQNSTVLEEGGIDLDVSDEPMGVKEFVKEVTTEIKNFHKTVEKKGADKLDADKLIKSKINRLHDTISRLADGKTTSWESGYWKEFGKAMSGLKVDIVNLYGTGMSALPEALINKIRDAGGLVAVNRLQNAGRADSASKKRTRENDDDEPCKLGEC